METARLIIDPPDKGAWNMSVDQALLETADKTGLVTLRIYRWSVPTLSLGYFQSHEDRDQHAASFDCELVRRKSGGGAILHDRELTYSLCIPSVNRWSSQNSELYELVHLALIDYLRSNELNVYLYKDESKQPNLASDEGDINRESPNASNKVDARSFMCFRRRSPGDICCQKIKVVGSAQRRQKHSLLQHGSILLKRSEFAPELPGINDLSLSAIDEEKLVAHLVESVENSLRIKLNLEKLSRDESTLANEICSQQFGTDDWNLRHSRIKGQPNTR